MIGFGSMLATITDGESAWADFISGVQRTFEQNAAAAPVLGIVLLVGAVILIDYFIAKWLVRQSEGGGKNAHSKKH
ncbi:MAG: hypothetical protein Phyf2KO_19010 [Phycisphaerales bacterium]